MTAAPRTFIFIVGPSGSGTTLLTRLLSAPRCAVALGGNYVSVSDGDAATRGLCEQLNDATLTLWDREAEMEAANQARRRVGELIKAVVDRPALAGVTHLVYKRSAPFMVGDRYRPMLHDLFELFAEPRIVVTMRDPRASTASSFRREFGRTLRHCAIITEEQLTHLSAQIDALGTDRFLRVPYEALCRDPQPWLAQLAEFCGLPEAELSGAADAERIDPLRADAWRETLTPAQVEFLDTFFSPTRTRQWPHLRER